MLTVAEGVLGSLPQVPVHSDSGTAVGHPGYAEV